MGAEIGSNENKLKKNRKIKEIEASLFVRVMNFDFNLKKYPQLTIEWRFCRENTNDLGEPFLP